MRKTYIANEENVVASIDITLVNENIKTYILDTNILLESPEAIFGFDDNNVVITGTTLQELDEKKRHSTLKYTARQTARIIESLREKGNLLTGVPMDNGGTFYIVLCDMTKIKENPAFSMKKGDNQILQTILQMKDSFPNCVLISNDTYMRLNASTLGISAETYRNTEVSENGYSGREELFVDKTLINKIYAEQKIDFPSDKPAIENEYFILRSYDEKQSALARYHNGKLLHVKDLKPFGICPKNSAQKFALDALLDESIPLVILRGPAGCAKTFLSLAAGLEQTYDSKNERKYRKIMITRNNVTNDEGFGYLPGELEEKMQPLIAPFLDNLESLIRNGDDISNQEIQDQIDYLFDTGTIEIAPMAYMRGRSIRDTFLILDEAQNATISQVRDVITRAGKGTKIVLCGDPTQIDALYLNEKNNGLNYTSAMMKNSPMVAQITFTSDECVRSTLAKEAIEKL